MARIFDSVQATPLDDFNFEDAAEKFRDYAACQNGQFDPTLFAHQMVWAYKISDYWTDPAKAKDKCLRTVDDFFKHLKTIARQYERYYAKLDERKRRPEDVCPSLVNIVLWRESIKPLYDDPITNVQKAQELNPQFCKHDLPKHEDCAECERAEYARNEQFRQEELEL